MALSQTCFKTGPEIFGYNGYNFGTFGPNFGGELKAQSNLRTDLLPKLNVVFHPGVAICHSLISMTHPKSDEVFRDPLLSEMGKPESPERMKPGLPDFLVRKNGM